MAKKKQSTKLSEKQLQALELIKGGMPRKEVAAQMGWGIDYFKKLCSGDIDSGGYIADIFKKELQKIEADKDENIKVLVRDNIETAQSLIRISLAELKAKKKLDNVEKKLLTAFTNSLNKSTPAVNIKSLSFSYTKGLTPEELIHEFSRLKGIAEGSFDGRGIQKTQPDGSGRVSGPDEPRDRLAQDT